MNMLDIGKYRGVLWKKIKESEEKTIALPGFNIEETKIFDELSTAKSVAEVDMKYHLIPPFAYAHIKWNPATEQVEYDIEEPTLTEDEIKILKKIQSSLIDMIQVGLSSVKNNQEATKYLEELVKKAIVHLGISLTPEQYIKFMYYVYRNFVGYNEIEPFLRDPWIEDIGCDGVGIPIYIVHRKYGSIKSNVIFKDVEYLREFVIKLAERTGRYVSYAEPILDGTLPDGSRVNASLASDVTTSGPTFSIRKFAERPFSPIDLIELGTATPDLMAYFWFIVEGGASLLIAGGVATGKTTILNSICMFIPSEAKIVSIEDTRELRLTHEHWIPTVSRLGFGIPLSTGEKYGEITLFDLLKGSFRQNPDYVIVGEVRGKEAYVMFQGMSSGHPSFATFHAGSVDTVIKRLTTPPIELSASLVESLDAIAIMVHAKERGKSARRIKTVEEIIAVDPVKLQASVFKASEWDPSSDTYKVYLNGSHLLEKIARTKGIEIGDAIKEIEKRKAVLVWMCKNNIKDFEEVDKIINEFSKNPKKVLEKIGKIDLVKEIEEIEKKRQKIKASDILKEGGELEKIESELPQKVEVEEQPTIVTEKSDDIYSIFGYKIIKEKKIAV